MKVFFFLILPSIVFSQCTFTIEGSLSESSAVSWEVPSNWSSVNCSGISNTPASGSFNSNVNIIVNGFVIISSNLYQSSKPNLNITVNGHLIFDKTGNGQLNLDQSSTIYISSGASIYSNVDCVCNKIQIGNGKSVWEGSCGEINGPLSIIKDIDICLILKFDFPVFEIIQNTNECIIKDNCDSVFYSNDGFNFTKLLTNSYKPNTDITYFKFYKNNKTVLSQCLLYLDSFHFDDVFDIKGNLIKELNYNTLYISNRNKFIILENK